MLGIKLGASLRYCYLAKQTSSQGPLADNSKCFPAFKTPLADLSFLFLLEMELLGGKGIHTAFLQQSIEARAHS